MEGSLCCRRLLPFWGYCGLWITPFPLSSLPLQPFGRNLFPRGFWRGQLIAVEKRIIRYVSTMTALAAGTF